MGVSTSEVVVTKDPREIAINMKRDGSTVKQIVAALAEDPETKRSQRWVYNILSAEDLVNKEITHKEWLPWIMPTEHRQSADGQKIMILSRIAQGGHETSDRVNSAVPWAARLIAEGLDYDYEATQGIVMVPRPAEESRLLRLFTAANRAIQEKNDRA
ncbi:hypothetical protein [Streptomyces sp. NPDC059708]|uniref:hypothetical protein n=1 Tax=Streptomyces sp. NPDC059708 TaxID=3346916 RepID=UPI00368DA5EF